MSIFDDLDATASRFGIDRDELADLLFDEHELADDRDDHEEDEP